MQKTSILNADRVLNMPLRLMNQIFKKMSFIRLGQRDGDSFSLYVFLNMFISFMAILYNNKYVTIMAIWSSKNIFLVDVSLKNAEQSIIFLFSN